MQEPQWLQLLHLLKATCDRGALSCLTSSSTVHADIPASTCYWRAIILHLSWFAGKRHRQLCLQGHAQKRVVASRQKIDIMQPVEVIIRQQTCKLKCCNQVGPGGSIVEPYEDESCSRDPSPVLHRRQSVVASDQLAPLALWSNISPLRCSSPTTSATNPSVIPNSF